MSSPRVIFINRFYWPDEPATAQLLTDLAEALARDGLRVSVIARQTSHESPRREIQNAVEITRIPATRFGRKKLLGRALDYATFLFGAKRALRSLARRGDVVVTMTDPPLLGTYLSNAIRARGAAQIHWVQDIFPEVARAVSETWIPKTLYTRRNRAWKNARHCIVPGEDMAEFVFEHGASPDHLTVCENWAPAGLHAVDARAWRERHGLENAFVVMYSGNLGRVHDFSSVVPLARALKEETSVRFVFVGDGARRAELERDVAAAKLTNVLFLAPAPRSELAETLSAADLHLATLRAGCETFVFPSKLYGIAAVARPVLFIGPIAAEIARSISAHRFGAAFAPDDIENAADFVRGLARSPAQRDELGRAAETFFYEHGQLSRAVATWRGVLDPLIQLAPARQP